MGTLTDDEDEDLVAAVLATEGAEVELEDEGTHSEPEVEVVEDDGRAQDGDERLSQTDEGEDRHERRPKESAADRRARAKLAKERDKRELDFQRRELSRQDALIRDLQKGQVVTRINDLDSRIATANAEAETYDQVHYKALEAKNIADARAAAKIRDEAKQRAWDAFNERQGVLKQAQTPAATPPPYQGMAEEFMAANTWYDHSGRDEDSQLVKQIDAAVAKEYIPTSPAYWKELQRRVQKNLPQHFQSNNDDDGDTVTQPQQRQRKGPPTGGSSRSNSSTSTQIRLSPERVATMKEAGMWDDLKQRAKMAKTYANYDREHQNG